jgi:4-hydroxy-3-methylbut-2-enyl diphosphate reductase
LRELAERCGTHAHLIDSAEDICVNWLDGKSVVGVTAGASAPEVLVQDVVERLKAMGAETAKEIEGRKENIRFSMPRELR